MTMTPETPWRRSICRRSMSDCVKGSVVGEVPPSISVVLLDEQQVELLEKGHQQQQ